MKFLKLWLFSTRVSVWRDAFLPILALLLGVIASFPAAAYDEIQVYDMSINQPGQFALEMHSNYVINGRKQADYDGELPPDGLLAFTPKFSYGWSSHVEFGLYLPMSINPKSGTTMLEDAKLRVKWLNADNPELFYGLNTDRIGAETLFWPTVGMEIRPIIGHYSGD